MNQTVDSTYNLSEIFYSIQGEGPHTGRASIFIRFSGCNLRCKWGAHRCDTPYTSWDPEIDRVNMDTILTRVRAFPKCKRIVITGGEPTLQAGLEALCAALIAEGYAIDLETNGTGPIPDTIGLIVCSPKLSDSTPFNTKYETMHASARVNFSSTLCGGDPRLHLKYVVGAETSLSEIQESVRMIGCPSDRVWLMPEALSPEDLKEQSGRVVALALEYGYNFTSRLHISLWGGVRGV